MKKTIAIITIVVGIIVMILGLCIQPGKVYLYNDSSYSVPGAAFGADFYTYVYDGIDTIVDELDDINEGMSDLVYGVKSICDTVAKVGKMIVISIGLLIVVMGLKELPDNSQVAPASQSPVSAPVAFTPVQDKGWVCTCGASHFDSISCSCGKTKEEVLRGTVTENNKNFPE